MKTIALVAADSSGHHEMYLRLLTVISRKIPIQNRILRPYIESCITCYQAIIDKWGYYE